MLDGWNAEAIARKIAGKRADAAVLRAWARQTHPQDAYRWHLAPELNYLLDPPGAG